jgi:hypothetical protein
MTGSALEELRVWALRNRLSIKELCAKLRISRSTFVAWGKGFVPSLSHAVAVEDLTGIPVRMWLQARESARAA